jgi:aryl-alcohol dehydrogenase-like predicted oxidoreductase
MNIEKTISNLQVNSSCNKKMESFEQKLIFGCASLSSLKTSREVTRLLNLAYENGVTHFDTAPLYGQGYSEVLVGKFIKDKRDKLCVTTKFGLGQNYDVKIPPYFALPLNYLKKKNKQIAIPATYPPGCLD